MLVVTSERNRVIRLLSAITESLASRAVAIDVAIDAMSWSICARRAASAAAFSERIRLRSLCRTRMSFCVAKQPVNNAAAGIANVHGIIRINYLHSKLGIPHGDSWTRSP